VLGALPPAITNPCARVCSARARDAADDAKDDGVEENVACAAACVLPCPQCHTVVEGKSKKPMRTETSSAQKRKKGNAKSGGTQKNAKGREF